ncbi:MAG: hypothetical protein H7838_00745 [Magnetococcus sp. DMHC-8]
MGVLLQDGLALATPPTDSHDVLCRRTPSCRVTLMARLPHAPFPYAGAVGDTDQPFFDRVDPDSGQRLHTVSEEVCYPEFPHYQDNRVLIHLPPTFKPGARFQILVFFHGHHTELNRTLVEEWALLRQVNTSGRNLVLVVPQMVLDAADSSPGKLYRPQGFANLLRDVSLVLKKELGKGFSDLFKQAPVILTAYSGGYRALAYTLDRGFASGQERDRRLRGVILLDALYSEFDKFADWLQHPGRRGFFVNLYGPSSEPLSRQLELALEEAGMPWSDTLKGRLKPRRIYSLAVDTPHQTLFMEGPPPVASGQTAPTRRRPGAPMTTRA